MWGQRTRLGILSNANAFNGLGNLIEFTFYSYRLEIRGFNVADILSRLPKLQQLIFNSHIRESIGDIDSMKAQFPNLKFIETPYCCYYCYM
jgi:hypothetical protein